MQSAGDHRQRDDIACPNPGDPPWFKRCHFRGRWQKQLGAQNSHHQYVSVLLSVSQMLFSQRQDVTGLGGQENKGSILIGTSG